MNNLLGHAEVPVDTPQHWLHNEPWGEGVVRAFSAIDAASLGRTGFWYMLSPYTQYPRGENAAWVHACRVAASLQAAGVTTFSPIVHSHPIARAAKVFPKDSAYWHSVNRVYLDACLGGIIAMLPGWDVSVGVNLDRQFLAERQKPIIQLPVPLELLD